MKSKPRNVIGITGGVSQQDNTIYIDFSLPTICGGSESCSRSYDANLDKLISKFTIGIRNLSKVNLNNSDDVQFFLENAMVILKHAHINWLSFSPRNCSYQLRHNCNLIRAFLKTKKEFNTQKALQIIGALNVLDNLKKDTGLILDKNIQQCRETIILQDSDIDIVECAKLLKDELIQYQDLLSKYNKEMHQAYDKIFESIHRCLHGCD